MAGSVCPCVSRGRRKRRRAHLENAGHDGRGRGGVLLIAVYLPLLTCHHHRLPHSWRITENGTEARTPGVLLRALVSVRARRTTTATQSAGNLMAEHVLSFRIVSRRVLTVLVRPRVMIILLPMTSPRTPCQCPPHRKIMATQGDQPPRSGSSRQSPARMLYSSALTQISTRQMSVDVAFLTVPRPGTEAAPPSFNPTSTPTAAP